jgi:subfamily B ATP-binding cassette protein MsbA
VVGERVVAQLRGDLFGRLVTLSLDFHSGRRVGELVSRLSSDVTLVRTMLTQTVTSLLSAVIGLVGSIIILFTLSPTLLFIVLLLAPALIAVAIVFGRPLQRVSTQVQDTIARSTTTAEEALSGIRVVKSYVREDWELERYDADLRTVVATGSRLALWRAMFGALMGLLGFGALAGLLWYTGHQVIDGQLGIGTLTGFLLYGVAIAASLGTIAGLYGQFREGTGAITRVFEIIDTRPTILDAPDARPLTRVDGRIELEAVSFGYGPDRLVLRDVSLVIPAGETLALVGPSGSGKTTLTALIPRLWDVTSGTIRIDGQDVRDVTVASLRGQIGLVAQEATLFGAQMQRAKLDGADLSGARIVADLTGASLVGASIANGNLGADMKNQPMGLMRSVLRSANLKGVNARGADLSRVALEFASLVGADLSGASLMGATLGGADLTGVTVTGTDFNDADLVSAKLIRPVGLDAAKNFDKAKNVERVQRDE